MSTHAVDMKRPRNSSFSRALRTLRKARGRSQEDFDAVSSRTYISALERGLKQPTLSKVDELAEVMDVHPLTLLALSYCVRPTSAEAVAVLDAVREEVLRFNLRPLD